MPRLPEIALIRLYGRGELTWCSARIVRPPAVVSMHVTRSPLTYSSFHDRWSLGTNRSR